MANIPVSPPPQPRYPKAIAEDKEARTYFDNLNRVILQLWKRTGGNDDLVNQAATDFSPTLSSAIFDIREQIGSGIPVTIDTTGFTVDTTEQTTDMTEQ
jgi:hypothetical protein